MGWRFGEWFGARGRAWLAPKFAGGFGWYMGNVGLEVMMSANTPEAGMCVEAIQSPGEPLVSSIILSMTKL